MYTKNDRDLAEDKKEKDTVNTVTCEFHCVSSEKRLQSQIQWWR